MDLLTLVYYLTLFFIPIVLRIVFTKGYKSIYTERTWYSIIKEYIARHHIKHYQKSCRKKLAIWSEEILETPRLFLNPDKDNDTITISGLDEDGNSIKIRLLLRQESYAELTIRLCVTDGRIFQLPNEPRVLICDTDPNVWKAGGLTIALIEPLRSYRVTFNGFMRNTVREHIDEDIGNIEHIKFNFIWRTASDPIHYPQDYSWKLIAENLARERWRDHNWLNLLGDSQSYEHYGSMQGFITGTSFPTEECFYFKSLRKRSWGKADCFALNRDLSIYVTISDGTLFNVGIKSLKNGCSHFKYGSIRFNDTQTCSIQNTDLNLDYIGENNVIPDAFTFHVKAANRTLKCVLHLQRNKQTKTFNDESIGWKTIVAEAECFVNSKPGRALLTFWYPYNGNYVSSPQKILREEVVNFIKAPEVINFKSPGCTNLQYTGGKGKSLGFLTNIKSTKFKVPEGFVITTESFRKQLRSKSHLQDSIRELEDVSRGKIVGDLETFCKKTVKLIESEQIEPTLTEVILNELNEIKPTLNETSCNLKWAVRSSGVCEDSDDMSAAGQNSTFLGVSTNDDLLKAITACWASLFTFQSVQYRRQYGFKVDSDIAVVVQRMIDSDSAGVLFTCHPTTHDLSKMVITGNFGLGESVVSGQIEPDTIIIRKKWQGDVEMESKQLGSKDNVIKMKKSNSETIHDILEFINNEKHDQICLTDNQIEKLADVGVMLEKIFDGPRDIEWAFHKDELYLLQSRPITTLNTWTKYELLHEFDSPIFTKEELNLRSNVGEVMPLAITPLTLNVITKGIDKSCSEYGGLTESSKYYLKHFTMFQYVLHISGFNIIYRALEKEITLTNKLLDISLSGHTILNEKIHKTAMERFGPLSNLKKLTMFAIHLKFVFSAKNCIELADDACKKLDKNAQKVLRNCKTASELFCYYDNLNDEFFDVYLPHHKASMNISLSEVIALNIVCYGSDDLTPDHYTDIANLLSSCENVVSADVPLQLEKISKRLIALKLHEEFSKVPSKDGIDWLQKHCPEVKKMFDEFIKTNGHRGLIEFELMEPSWEMKPEIVIEMLQQNCKNINETKRNPTSSLDEILNNLKNPVEGFRRTFLKFMIQLARKGVGYRENTKSELIRATNIMRKYFLRLGELMVLDGILPNKELIYLLTIDEMRHLIHKPNPTIVFKCTMRLKEYRTKWKKIRFPEISFGIPKPIDEEIKNYVVDEKNFKMRGTPASSGDIVGRACVIRSLDEIHLLKAGDILITHATDIGWSPYFPILSGVVTELGGLISHGAVVAREYGLPCLIGVTDACNYFKTGDQVLLSGTSGKLELISRD